MNSEKGDPERIKFLKELIAEQHKKEDEKAIINKEDLSTPDNWISRNPDLIRLTGPHPMNAEPPAPRLMEFGFITPTSLHYVRNHGSVPKIKWEEHTLSITGMVENEKTFKMDEIIKLPNIEIAVTLTCDGNRRKEVNMKKHSLGFNWGPAATGTSIYKGVPLHHILKLCKIKNGARYVWFEGADDLPKGKYVSSLSCSTVMDPSNDVILAFEMNGKKLPPDHGFPIRLVVPGYVGARSVKWLSKITVTYQECENHYYVQDNRVLPPDVDWSTAYQHWKNPGTIIKQLNINSVITHPPDNEYLLVTNQTMTYHKISGFAYSGGGRRIVRVEITLDGGTSWIQCNVRYPADMARHGHKFWVWCHWDIMLESWKLIRANEIAVRAWDSSFNTQPKNITWNVLGMMNNAWYKVKVSTIATSHALWLKFTHPVLPNGLKGGWMRPSKQEAERVQPLVLPTPSTLRTRRQFTIDEVMKHNKENDCWVIINREVFDLSNYMHEHPGGKIPIILQGGQDATKLFYDIHGPDANDIKDYYLIGRVVEHAIPQTLKPAVNIALNPRRWISIILKEKIKLTHDTRRFIFELPDKSQKLGLAIGHHVLLGVDIGDVFVVRPYTPVFPITLDEDTGVIHFVIKIYFAGVNKLFPQGGIMSQHLDSLKIGDTMQMKGPAGHILYNGNGIFTIHGQSMKVNKISMVAGGTGITPMYQLIQAIHKEMSDIKVALLYANHTEEDILLRKELDELQEKNKNFKVWYTVANPPKDWKYSVGFVNEEMMRFHLFPPSDDSIALMCGPPAMIEHACIPILENLGYDERNLFEF